MKFFLAVLCLGLVLSSASSAMACTNFDCGGFNLQAVCAWQYGNDCLGVKNNGGAYAWGAIVRFQGERDMDLKGYLGANARSILPACLPGNSGNGVLVPTCGNDRDAYCWKITACV
jgi:hypothetical protein